MATYTWTAISNGGTATWSTSSDWTSSTVPGSSTAGNGDVAVLANASKTGTYTVAFDKQGWNVGSLTTGNGSTLLFNTANASLTINNGALLTGNASTAITLDGSNVSLTVAQGTGSYGLNQSTGAFNVLAGNASITGGETLSAGSVIISNDSTLGAAGTLTADTLSVTGGVVAVSASAASLQVSGKATFTTSNSANVLQVSGGIASFGTLILNGATTDISVTGGTVSSTGQMQVGLGDTVTLGGGTLISSKSGISNNGTVTGFGAISAGLAGTGRVIANSGSGGTLAISGAVAGQSFSINNNSVLQFGSSVAAGETITFNGATGEVLGLTDATNDFAGTINNFVAGDSIVVSGAASYVSSGSTVQAWSGINGTGSVLATIASTSALGTHTENTSAFTVCFAAGSRIRTEQGDVAVEELAEGQRVAVLRDGAIAFTPITWIGERRINLAAHPQPQTAAPVRIRSGAIGENLPERDLLLSPDHCLFLDGKLVPAKSLINGMTIVQERALPAVHYFHVEVDPHAVLLAEGLPVESYLDTGNRAYFENCGAALVLHPEFTINAGLKAWETHACAPLTVQPQAVQPMWQRLAERAEAMGFSVPQPETTEDPDLHLVAAGRAIRPMAVRDGRYVFALPAGCASVRLVSRASIPSDLAAWLDDWRPLGVAVTNLVARTPNGQQMIPADHPGLVRGWHAVETDGATTWRWTAGDAELVLDVGDGPVIVEVHVCNTARYIVEPAQQERQSLAA